MYERLIPNLTSDEEVVSGSQRGIDLVKAGQVVEARAAFLKVLRHAQSQGATVALMGCTEIPVALTQAAVDDEFGAGSMALVSTVDVGVQALTGRVLRGYKDL